MKILSVHNFYLQSGGEDEVFRLEAELLRAYGHHVIEYTRKNTEDLQHQKLKTGASAIWNYKSAGDIQSILEDSRVDIIHCHNIFPLISPCVYYMAHRFRVPLVQSIHNPRLMCPSGNFYRKGTTCTDCLGRRFAWPGVYHGCYHGMRSQSLGAALYSRVHRTVAAKLGTGCTFIVFTDFYKQLLCIAGWPEDRIAVKPHFTNSSNTGEIGTTGQHFLYVGRLDPEKGFLSLLLAWREVNRVDSTIKLKVRGDGSLLQFAREFSVKEGLNIEFIPKLARSDLDNLFAQSLALLWPSLGYYETFGLVVIEAYAAGVPVAAYNTGVAAELIRDEVTGLLVPPNDHVRFAAAILKLAKRPDVARALGGNARSEYLSKYTPARNYDALMSIYRRALSRFSPDRLPLGA